MSTTIELPPKSSKLEKLEEEAAAATAAVKDFRSRVDPSGAEILRPEEAKRLREDAKRIHGEHEAKTGQAREANREESWSRADRLLKLPSFRAALEAKAVAHSRRLDELAALLVHMDLAGADGIRIHSKIYLITPTEVEELRLFVAGFRRQGLDPKILTPGVKAYFEMHQGVA